MTDETLELQETRETCFLCEKERKPENMRYTCTPHRICEDCDARIKRNAIKPIQSETEVKHKKLFKRYLDGNLRLLLLYSLISSRVTLQDGSLIEGPCKAI